MYAIVHKNKVIMGPKEWEKAFFTFILNNVGIQNPVIPRDALQDSELPYIIDADTKLFKVIIEKNENINLMIEYYQGPIFTINESEVIATYEIIENSVEFSKNNFKNLASSVRYDKEVSGIELTIQDTKVFITTKRVERDRFAQKLMTLNDSEVINWKFSEGWLTLTKQELQTIVTSIENHVQSTFDWEKTIDVQIVSAQTNQELLDIVIES